jgi:simple sugar transport system ATP-binding protein
MPNRTDEMATVKRGPLVSLRGISKGFPNVQANDSVDLDLLRGEIHALLGENGAGKSTLMKILYGFYRADKGEIIVDGEPQTIRSPVDARRLRIGMVFQTFTLIPALSVAENIALYLPDLPAIPSRARIARQIREVSARYGLGVNPEATVRDLCIGDQQKVEVLKLLLADARVLIFDEATRVLAPHEIESLFEVLKRLRDDGYSIVFITHKLREVLACADRITVMRRGRIAGTLSRCEATEGTLVSLMFEAAAPSEVCLAPGRRTEPAAPSLELRGVSTRARGGQTGLKGIDLVLHPGEILGVAGVSGNGQRELGDVILGLLPCAAGRKLLFGEDATRWSAGRIRRSGVGFVPEEPLAMGVVPWMTVLQNAALGDLEKYSRCGGLALDWSAVRADVERSYGALGLSAPGLHTQARALSGGNLQRAILARELGRLPRLVVASYPTRGLDVVSATSARRLLTTIRDSGASVLLVSEDLDELYGLSDRLIVLFEGRIVRTALPTEIGREEIGHLMTGTGCGHAQ